MDELIDNQDLHTVPPARLLTFVTTDKSKKKIKGVGFGSFSTCTVFRMSGYFQSNMGKLPGLNWKINITKQHKQIHHMTCPLYHWHQHHSTS
eukprot:4249469-Karenia_brevis.AAC.1